MRVNFWLAAVLLLVFAVPESRGGEAFAEFELEARVVAVGLPAVAGVRQVGRFHSGGPIPSNPEFLLDTNPGSVLDPERVLVAAGANFGAPKGDQAQAEGAILSVDPSNGGSETPIVIPSGFALQGGQAAALDGAVRLYTAQSPPFFNGRYNSGARTAGQAAASGPRYISINNAFGRPWIANAPFGVLKEGTVTVVDPDGAPLDNAPSSFAGGVFAGAVTNREWVPKGQASGWFARLFNYRDSPQLTKGDMQRGALGTAFLGASPDGSGFAVFAVVMADGSVVQAHVQDGVDGLAPPGTVSAIEAKDDPGVIGIAFEWTPERALYIADHSRNRLAVLHLSDDQKHFTITRRSEILSPFFNEPVDVAAAVPEIANPQFSSHTTLSGGSDLYVLNRGDGTIVRVDQNGDVSARARITVPGLGPLGGNRLRAIAVSADAQRIWLSAEGTLPGFESHAGALIEVAAFGAEGAVVRKAAQAAASQQETTDGEELFRMRFKREQGLGPLFNATACIVCHPGPGGAGADAANFVRRVARMDPVTGRVLSIDHPNSPVARRFGPDGKALDVPPQANVVSLRMPPALYPIAHVDEIPDAVIEAQAVSKGDNIKGRVNYVTSRDGAQRIGRYGWKADIATLEEMVADAFANELGITSALAPHARENESAEDDGEIMRAVAAYLRTLSAAP